MKDRKLFKKWWFWLVVLVVLGAIGSLSQSGKDSTVDNTNSQQTASNTTSNPSLPKLNADDYKGKEGLVVYKDLKSKGYKVEATFQNQALTDINGKATDVFEPLDPSKADDRRSIDSFVVEGLTQNGDSVELSISKVTR